MTILVPIDWREETKKDLRVHEGKRLKAYVDTVGVWTIGVGHTRRVKKGDVATDEQVEKWLEEDLAVAVADAKAVCKCFDQLSGPRKSVVVNMSFNLGLERLAMFQRTLAAICAGDYKQAALHMMDSKWATQVKGRANFLAKRMASGKW